jgi:hypothetical protein
MLCIWKLLKIELPSTLILLPEELLTALLKQIDTEVWLNQYPFPPFSLVLKKALTTNDCV